MMKKILGLVATTVVAVLLGVGVAYLVQTFFSKPYPINVGSSTVTKTSYDVIGTADTDTTLSTTYASSTKTISAAYMDNLHLDVSFTPNATNTYMNLFVEVSNDNGETFFPLTTKSVGTTEILNYVTAPDGSVGIPLVFPGSKVTTSSVEYKGALDYTIVGDQVRISAATNSGTSTAYVRATLSSTN